MESDRRSATSSFYGNRRSTGDALNNYLPNSTGQDHLQDYASSFYQPDRASRPTTELLNGPRSAGYNRMSFFDAGRVEPLKGGYDEEERLSEKDAGSWDVFADFNNTGPRYSTAFTKNEPSYQPLPPPPNKSLEAGDNLGNVEMVTVPALGPEWNSSEMRNMTKKAKREDAAEVRGQKWKEWRRGERGMCGNYFTRRFTVFFMFGLCAAIGILLAFMIPRVPGFAFNQNTPLIPATGSFNASIPAEFSRAPANFSFPAYASVQVDTNSNFLPLKFNQLNAQVFDLDTGIHVGNGGLRSYTVPAKAFTNIAIPLNFTYIATNDTDTTWSNWYNACKNPAIYPNGQRPGLRFRLVLDMTIAGLVTSSQTSTDVTSANCPITLPINAA